MGALLGAFLVTQFDNDALVIWLGVYFIIIGTTVILKTLRPSFIRLINTRREILGFIGGFLDAFGGAGWGEFVSSGLLLRGYEVRKVIGSLVTVEFIIAVAVSVVFYNTIGIKYWPQIIALSLGAIAAAPIGALICQKVSVVPLTLLVGCVVVFIGIKTVLIQNSENVGMQNYMTGHDPDYKLLRGSENYFTDFMRSVRIWREFRRGFTKLNKVGKCVTFFGSARLKEDNLYYTMAYQTAYEVGKNGYSVMTGGGPGIMEAANKGAKEAGALSIGCNIELPVEQIPNAFTDIQIRFHHFFVESYAA